MTESTLCSHEVLYSMCIYLPLFHVFVTWECLGVLVVEVIIWDENRVSLRANRIEHELTNHEEASIDAAERSIVRMDLSFVIVIHDAWLNGEVPEEGTTAEIREIKTICDGAFSKDA